MSEPLALEAKDGCCRRAIAGSLWVLGALGVLTFIYRRVAAGRVLATGDLHTYFYPYWSEIARSLRGGTLPLWNGHLFAGAPLLANSQAGVFYPLNWPLWLLAGGTPLGAARALHASVLLHLGFAVITTYNLARRLGMAPFAAALSGLLYAGSGFLGVHVEHLNQLQGLAWLPLLLLPSRIEDGIDWPPPISIVGWALILLAGHTQTAFIAAIVLLIWHTGRLLFRLGRRQGVPRAVWIRLAGLLTFGLGVVAAMVQLLPTLQLAQFSNRRGGLPWREAVSFSIAPWTLPQVLLPPYLVGLQLPEGVAYLGISGLILAAVGLGWGRRRRGPEVVFALLAGIGVFLALGGYNPLYVLAVRLGMPGLVHFRAPARFLALTVIGGALLAGRGAEVIVERLPSGSLGRRAGLAALWLVGAAELIVAAEYLPHADATAPMAYTDLRPAAAFLVSASQQDRAQDRPPHRFLSISQMLFEVGDKSELSLIYEDVLSGDALWELWISAKQREVLTPNLPMVFGVPAADGYDGGLLPLRHYATFSRLLVPDGTLDGRLRENLSGIPDARWLSLLGVEFLLTDKTADAWVDDVFYDRQFQPEIPPDWRLEIAALPSDFDANALGLLYTGTGGQVTLTLASGEIRRKLPTVSEHVDGMVSIRLRWDEPGRVTALAFQADSLPLKLMGASLIDERTGAFYPLVLSNRFKMAHSGDIKIYQDIRERTWATVLGRCQVAASESEALARMEEPDFDPEAELILVKPQDGGAVDLCEEMVKVNALTAAVDRIRYRPGAIDIEVSTSAPAFLLVKEAWYPGWRAVLSPGPRSEIQPPHVQFQEVSVLRGDLLMMAVPVPEGRWCVEITYRPRIVRWGAALSAVGWLGIVIYARQRKAANSRSSPGWHRADTCKRK